MTGRVQIYRGQGRFDTVSLAALTSDMEARRLPLQPVFAPERIGLIGRYAAQLQADTRWRGMAPVVALAFWLRKAAMMRMAAVHRDQSPPHSRATSRGIAFHLPPQNVDTQFLYSWAVAFACGNVNIVRLPEQLSPTMAALLDPLIVLLAEHGCGDVFLTYPRQEEAVNRDLSAIADCRLVWGGDAKAELFNLFPLRIGGKSLMFADRYSHAVVSAKAVEALDETGRGLLAKALHDDIRLFDQQACSSPHTIHLLDASETGLAAMHDILERVDSLARHLPSVDAAHGMAKFAAACAMAAADTAIEARRLSNETTVVLLASAQERGTAIGGGFLSLRPVKDMEEITATFTARDQTITHFGLDADAFERLAALAAVRGVSRIVPVGSALSFDIIWDGYDLVGELTRTVRVMPLMGNDPR